MHIKFVLTPKDYDVLKKALKNFKGTKTENYIRNCLLNIIEYQKNLKGE